MVTAMPGGRRRIDRVLAPDFTADIQSLPMPEVRRRRQEAMQEEADLSYVRRMLQGRIDLLHQPVAETAESDADLVARVTAALVTPGATPAVSSRHLVAEPTRLAERRRYVERLIADVGLSDPAAMSAAELRAASERLAEQERVVSESRRQVHEVIDTLTAELARRYADGSV